jgi:hypothetical protein
VSTASTRLARVSMVPALTLLLVGVSATAASAHAGDENPPARELVESAIAILEVHPEASTPNLRTDARRWRGSPARSAIRSAECGSILPWRGCSPSVACPTCFARAVAKRSSPGIRNDSSEPPPRARCSSQERWSVRVERPNWAALRPCWRHRGVGHNRVTGLSRSPETERWRRCTRSTCSSTTC